jgi:hypothetical protein
VFLSPPFFPIIRSIAVPCIYIKLMSEHSLSEVKKQNFVRGASDFLSETYLAYMVPTLQEIGLHFIFILAFTIQH